MSRTDLFVTTAQKPTEALTQQGRALAAEVAAAFVPRKTFALANLFAAHPGATRALMVQSDRLVLVSRDGWELFFHPNMAYLRLTNILRGERDLLLEAAQLRPGDSVLDGTLGFAGEAILCAWAVGPTGEVHGVEATEELGIVVRDGLGRLRTASATINEAMRRVQVVHLGHHLDYLRACPDRRYDVICFDPFFDCAVGPQEELGPLRAFGEHAPLLPETLAEARRVARRRILVKAARWSPSLAALGITERVETRRGKVAFGVVRLDEDEEATPCAPS